MKFPQNSELGVALSDKVINMQFPTKNKVESQTKGNPYRLNCQTLTAKQENNNVVCIESLFNLTSDSIHNLLYTPNQIRIAIHCTHQ